MKFLNLKNWSLRTKLIAMTTTTCLTIFLVAEILFLNNVEKIEKQREQEYVFFSTSLSSFIANQFYERYVNVQSISKNPLFKASNLENSEMATKVLNEYTKMYGVYDAIVIVDSSGRFFASNTIGIDGQKLSQERIKAVNHSESTWFKNTMAGAYTEDKKKGLIGTFFEDAQIDPISTILYGEDRFGTSFSTKIVDEKGGVIGVISARADFRWVENQIVDYYQKLKSVDNEESSITILNKDGTIIADYDPQANNSSEQVVRNLKDTILQVNLIKGNVEAAKEAIAGKTGSMYSVNSRKKVLQLVSYTPITSNKFLSDIGWIVLVRAAKVDIMGDIAKERNVFLLSLLSVTVFALVVTFVFASRISRTIGRLSEQLTSDGGQVAAASLEAAASSAQLSASTSEQAAALQETVAAIDQIGAMLSKSADTASRSNTVSKESQEAAIKGQNSVRGMLEAVNDISISNAHVMTEVDNSNKEISEIVKLIADISNKTKVINDIVFQTKLLSFNASVEAARAGEHGKGFAVVAEEVGNLAQMSGNASKEIALMLSSSIEKVEAIVERTRSKMSTLVQTGREKVEFGSARAKECEVALESILQNITSVSELVNEISHACQEQDQGIKQVTMSMSQMETVTQQNATVARQSADIAANLKSRSESMRDSVATLTAIVGESAGSTNRTSKSLNPSNDGKNIQDELAASTSNTEPNSKTKTSNIRQLKVEKSNDRVAVNVNSMHKFADGAGINIPDRRDSRFEP